MLLQVQNAQMKINTMWEKNHLVGINSTWPMHGMHHCWLMCMNQKFFAMWVNPANTSLHMCGCSNITERAHPQRLESWLMGRDQVGGLSWSGCGESKCPREDHYAGKATPEQPKANPTDVWEYCGGPVLEMGGTPYGLPTMVMRLGDEMSEDTICYTLPFGLTFQQKWIPLLGAWNWINIVDGKLECNFLLGLTITCCCCCCCACCLVCIIMLTKKKKKKADDIIKEQSPEEQQKMKQAMFQRATTREMEDELERKRSARTKAKSEESMKSTPDAGDDAPPQTKDSKTDAKPSE